jgi:hypothetical protein
VWAILWWTWWTSQLNHVRSSVTAHDVSYTGLQERHPALDDWTGHALQHLECAYLGQIISDHPEAGFYQSFLMCIHVLETTPGYCHCSAKIRTLTHLKMQSHSMPMKRNYAFSPAYKMWWQWNWPTSVTDDPRTVHNSSQLLPASTKDRLTLATKLLNTHPTEPDGVQSHFRLVFRRCLVWILVGTPAIMT